MSKIHAEFSNGLDVVAAYELWHSNGELEAGTSIGVDNHSDSDSSGVLRFRAKGSNANGTLSVTVTNTGSAALLGTSDRQSDVTLAPGASTSFSLTLTNGHGPNHQDEIRWNWEVA